MATGSVYSPPQKLAPAAPHGALIVTSLELRDRSTHPHRPPNRLIAVPARYAWARLLARMDEAVPLLCPTGGGTMRIVASLAIMNPHLKRHFVLVPVLACIAEITAHMPDKREQFVRY